MAVQKVLLPMSLDARELQRRYAASVFRMHGHFDDASGIAPPKQDTFELSRYSVTDFGEKVRVKEIDGLGSPPLLAYLNFELNGNLNGNQPLDLHVTYETDGSVGGIAVSIPKHSVTTYGFVQLVWPTKTIQSVGRLSLRPKSSIIHFDLDKVSVPPNGTLVIIWPHGEPSEVHIGTTEIERQNWSWNKVALSITVPKGLSRGPVLVLTKGGVCQSNQQFQPTDETRWMRAFPPI